MVENEKSDEEKQTEQEAREAAAREAAEAAKNDSGNGDGAEKADEVTSDLDRADDINKETARLQKEKKEILEREEKLESSRRVGGRGQMMQEKAKPKRTDKELAEAYERGEIDPMRDEKRW